MKKICWLLLLIPFYMTKVLASEVYYSNYSNYSDYQEEKVISSDVVNVEEVMMYKWHKWVKEIGDYKLYNSSNYFTDDCYETDYSAWSIDMPNLTDATLLDERVMYKYQMIQPIRYIHLYNLHGSYEAFRIPELQVYVDNDEINYNYICSGCLDGFDEYIHNGIYIENNSYIKNNGHLIIDLGKEYPVDKIRIVFYIFDLGNDDKTFTLGYSKEKDDILFSKNYSYEFSFSHFSDSPKFEYHINDLDVNWLYEYVTDNYLDDEYIYTCNEIKEYRYKEKMCREYTLKKEYYPYYSPVSVDDYTINDSEKLFYRYQTRDKLEINMHDIEERNYDLNQFVVYSSNPYSITDNINWDKNGTYTINFKLNDIDVSKKVNVKLMDNSLKDEEIENLKEKLKQLMDVYENIVNNIEKSNIEYSNKLEELRQSLIDLNASILLETNNIENVLNEKIMTYEWKLSELYSLYQNNVGQLNNIFDVINDLNIRVDNIDNAEIQSLKLKIDQICEDYNSKLNDIEKLNDDYLLKLISINSKIEEIINKLNENNLINENMYNNILDRIREDETITESLAIKISDLNNQDDFIKQVQDELLGEINKLKEELSSFYYNFDDTYYNLETKLDSSILEHEKITGSIDKIEELDEKLKNISLQIEQYDNFEKQIISNDNYTVATQNNLNQKILEYKAQVDFLNGEINKLKEEINSLKQDFEDDILEMKIKQGHLEEVVNKLSLTELSTNENKFKNNYLLKINGVTVINLLWLYISLIIILIIIMVRLIIKKKKSSSFVESIQKKD